MRVFVKQFSTLIIVAASLVATNTQAGIIWDNGMDFDGFNGRATSPPGFPDIRTVDDFVVAAPAVVTGLNVLSFENPGWFDGSDMEVYVHSDSGGAPGALLAASTTSTWGRLNTGINDFGLDLYRYTITGLNLALGTGTHWIGWRTLGGATGSTFWATSNPGADNQGSTGFWNQGIAGGAFSNEGSDWHHAFQVVAEQGGGDVPVPATLGLLGLGLILLGRRRTIR